MGGWGGAGEGGEGGRVGSESERLGGEGEGPGVGWGIEGSVCLGGYVSGVCMGLWGLRRVAVRGWCASGR